MSHLRTERGAVAVEMALLLPILIMLLLGIMEFGRALNTQATLSHAARESVRVVALTGNPSEAKDAAEKAAPTLTAALMVVTPSDPCPSSVTTTPPMTTVTINYKLSTLTGVAGPFDMKAEAVMLCGG